MAGSSHERARGPLEVLPDNRAASGPGPSGLNGSAQNGQQADHAPAAKKKRRSNDTTITIKNLRTVATEALKEDTELGKAAMRFLENAVENAVKNVLDGEEATRILTERIADSVYGRIRDGLLQQQQQAGAAGSGGRAGAGVPFSASAELRKESPEYTKIVNHLMGLNNGADRQRLEREVFCQANTDGYYGLAFDTRPESNLSELCDRKVQEWSDAGYFSGTGGESVSAAALTGLTAALKSVLSKYFREKIRQPIVHRFMREIHSGGDALTGILRTLNGEAGQTGREGLCEALTAALYPTVDGQGTISAPFAALIRSLQDFCWYSKNAGVQAAAESMATGGLTTEVFYITAPFLVFLEHLLLYFLELGCDIDSFKTKWGRTAFFTHADEASKGPWEDYRSKVLIRTSNNSYIRRDTAPFIVLGKDEYTRVHQAQLARAT